MTKATHIAMQGAGDTAGGVGRIVNARGEGGWLEALRRELESWIGTPYVAGNGCKGMGADCIGFGAGVYDALHGYNPGDVHLPRHSPDLAFNNPLAAARISEEIRQRWPDTQTVWTRARAFGIPFGLVRSLEPGDALIVAVGRSAPGHMMIVGTKPNELWHCEEHVGVCRAGLGQWASRVKRVWRSGVRDTWAESWRPSLSLQS